MSSLATSPSSSRKRIKKENSPGQPSPNDVRKSSSFSRIFSEEDELKILEAVLEIQEDKIVPKRAAAVIFNGIQNKISAGISMTQLAEKLRKLRDRYNKELDEKWNSHQKKLFFLCNKIWGTKQNIPNQQKRLGGVDLRNIKEENFEKNYPHLMKEIFELPNTWFSKDILRYVDRSVLQQLNSRWRKQNIEELQIDLKRVELTRENAKLVLDAHMSSSEAKAVATNDADGDDDENELESEDGDDDENELKSEDGDDDENELKSEDGDDDDDKNDQSEDIEDKEKVEVEVEAEADE